MNVAAFHQAKHLAGVTANVQRFAIEFARERIQRLHDVGDRSIAVISGVRRGVRCAFPKRSGSSPSPSSRRNRRRPDCPGKCCDRTCIRPLRRG